MKIGEVKLENPYILAPMAGVTDLPFRLLCKEQGAGLLCMEMISAKALQYKNKNTKTLLAIHPEEYPVSLQLFGSEPDIISEIEGKKAAKKAVNIGIFTSVFFIIVSQSWLLYHPAASDWAQPAIREIFSNTPRLMLVSVLVYAICQRFDVWAYHKWWALTKKRFHGDSRRALWLRNNGSTMISQLLNTILYTFGAFWGMYEIPTLISIALSSYVIFIVTSIADTPFVYLARRMHEKGLVE